MSVPQEVKLARHAGDLDDDGHDTYATGAFVSKIEGGQETIKAHGSMGSTETIDPTDGNVHTGTLNANCTITLANPVGSGAATLELYLTQDGTGSRLVTWPGSVIWPGGSAPTLTTTAGALDRIVLETLDGGTNWFGVMVGAGGGGSVSYATPAIVLGSSAAAGAASTVIRSDSTIAAFDATVPVTQAFGDTAATGSAAFAARRDHKHGMPASGGGAILIADTHSTPLVFADLIQNDAQDDLVYAD